MTLSLAMPTQAYNPSLIIEDCDKNLSDDQVDELEESLGWRKDIQKRLTAFFDASNIMGVENAYTHAIIVLKREDRNELFKALAYSSYILAHRLYADPRNAKAVELLKNLSKGDYSLSLANQTVDSVKVIEVDDRGKQQAQKIGLTLDALFTEIKAYKEKHEFSSAEFGAIFATAFMRQHNTLQQVIVKCIVTAMQSKIADEKFNPTETDQDVLAIYAVVNSLNESIYFPYI